MARATSLLVTAWLSTWLVAGCQQELVVGSDTHADLASDGALPAPADLAVDAGFDSSVDLAVPGVCGGGLTWCDGACRNLLDDRFHCGRCDNACTTGLACTTGMCRPCFFAGNIVCGNSCVDPLSSFANCGGCSQYCDWQKKNEFCDHGACKACAGGLTSCFGACTNLNTDPKNCGSCLNACPASAICTGGFCFQCRMNELACNNSCVDINNSGTDCGACGNGCGPGFGCVNTQCLPCAPGLTTCRGLCTNVKIDPLNCGACGAACAVGKQCVGGACV